MQLEISFYLQMRLNMRDLWFDFSITGVIKKILTT